MRKKNFPPLEDRFEFLGDGVSAGERSILSSAIFEVEERSTGNPLTLKLWRKSSTETDDDLRELWLHEMRQIQRVSAYEGARDVITDLVDLVEDETSFGIVLRQAGQPLSAKMLRANADHWLKSLSKRHARRLFWLNMVRIAKAIGVVHRHGLVHGRIDADAVMTDGRQEPDFRLGGLEWSLWFNAKEGSASHAKLSAANAEVRTGKAYSFDGDWRSFGELIAKCLGVRVEESGTIVTPEGSGSSYLDSAERALLKRLFVPGRQDVNDAATVGRAIEDILANASNALGVVSGALVMAVFPRAVGNAIYDATAGQIPIDEFRSQLAFIRADLAGGASLMVPAGFRAGGRLSLVTDAMVYTLVAFEDQDGPTWSIAFCTGAQRKGGFVGYGHMEEHRLFQPIEVGGARDAARTRDRLGPQTLDWSTFAARTEFDEPRPTETVQAALQLIEIVDTVMKAFDIFPIEVLKRKRDQTGRRTAVIRALPSNERDRIGKKIGILETSSALRRLFAEDHRDAGRQWRISLSSDLGSTKQDDVVANFVDVVQHAGSDAYEFELDDEVPHNAKLYLRADAETGTERVFGRHMSAIKALDTRVDLAEMLADPWRVRSTSSDRLDEAALGSLDVSKQEALREIWRTRPAYFVVGPPGVGKTRLATEFIWRRFEATSPRILLSSQGHDALDNLQRETKKALKSKGFNEAIVVRSPAMRRAPTEDDAPTVSLRHLTAFSKSRMVLEGPIGQRKRVMALLGESDDRSKRRMRSETGPPADSASTDSRTGIRAMENLVLDAADVIIAAANSAEIERLNETRQQFDWVIIEEAAKATGPELAGPMMLSDKRLLIGDHRQLPPFGADRTVAILEDHSLVEQTLDIAENYVGSLLRNADTENLDNLREDPVKLRQVGLLASKLLEPFRTFVEEDEKRQRTDLSHRRISSTLVEQRRMDPAIAEVVSKTFYEGLLKTADERRDLARNSAPPFTQSDRLPRSPIVVVDFPHVNSTGARQSLERGRPRWHNPREAEAVIDVLKQVRAKENGNPSLAVLSPYAAQVELLTDRIGASIRDGELAHLRDFRSVRGKSGDFVGTVDSFQGSEADLVVMSLVRNNEGSGASALGFLRDRRRMNVAISRAKWKMVFVGSLRFLKEAVQGVNPGGRKSIDDGANPKNLQFLSDMVAAIEDATMETRDGIPLATILRPGDLKRPK